jgi:DNA polymerase-3 subunit delta'
VSDEERPTPDELPGAPHPRETAAVFGHAAAEAVFLEAWRQRRLHHAWLLRGPRGVGKATFAYRLARAVLAGDGTAPASLDVNTAHPVARRVTAGSEPRLYTLRRPWIKDKTGGRHATVITAAAARAMQGKLFDLTAADGGWRVAIVDSADELGLPEAANALLKIVEEPPPRSLILMVTSQPGRLLPTIRSRCRVLDFAPLDPDDLVRALKQAGIEAADPVVTGLSQGSPGEAIRLAQAEAGPLWGELSALLAAAPGLPRRRLIALAKSFGGREQRPRLAVAVQLTVLMLRRLARAGAGLPLPPLPGEAAVAARLAPDLPRARAWAALAAEIEARAEHGMAVNLDPAGIILDMWLGIDAAAAPAVATVR